ncbi:hypothetical protein [Streptomyces sp. CC224B]|uniref:hypothetical protein n=1 Tax=Streptomyces sp. CC224B TaxID=3044571 RepID=UPI0024A7A773|nr:hypothetical protein [Streptomyces sp. CC224B]
MKEITAVVGWVVGIQGALGLLGKLFGGNSWGLVHKWWDVPTAGYAVLLVLGAALAFLGERGGRVRSRR